MEKIHSVHDNYYLNLFDRIILPCICLTSMAVCCIIYGALQSRNTIQHNVKNISLLSRRELLSFSLLVVGVGVIMSSAFKMIPQVPGMSKTKNTSLAEDLKSLIDHVIEFDLVGSFALALQTILQLFVLRNLANMMTELLSERLLGPWLAYTVTLLVIMWYILTNHWIPNNIIALAILCYILPLMYLDRISTGYPLLLIIFCYDIYAVFASNIMQTLSENLKVPLMLKFPEYILKNGVSSNNVFYLGLGDVVLPGVFIALLLRLDDSSNVKYKPYFCSGLIGYIIGMMAAWTICLMFKTMQPALFYLVPLCVGLPALLALMMGEFTTFYEYYDEKLRKLIPKLPLRKATEPTEPNSDLLDNEGELLACLETTWGEFYIALPDVVNKGSENARGDAAATEESSLDNSKNKN